MKLLRCMRLLVVLAHEAPVGVFYVAAGLASGRRMLSRLWLHCVRYIPYLRAC